MGAGTPASPPPHRRRVLVAGVGNVLRGDDGFGPAVVRALSACALPDDVRLIEVGIGGIALVHELMDGYDEVIVVDAVDRDGPPGSLYVLEPEVPDLSTAGAAHDQALAGDMHQAVPARVLTMARALGVLPRVVRIVGCQPAETDELTTTLSPEVERAVGSAVSTICSLLARDGIDPLTDLQHRDEVLQLLFWLEGEGLGPEVTVADLTRFVGDDAVVLATLARLIEDRHVEARADAVGNWRYRLTESGQREGRRRFLDEFQSYLARHGHADCGTADCDCRRGGECRAQA